MGAPPVSDHLEIDKSSVAYQTSYKRTRASIQKDIKARSAEPQREDSRAFLDNEKKILSINFGAPRVSYIFKCVSCGHVLPKGCPNQVYEYVRPRDGKLVTDEPFPCESCGRNPWDRGKRGRAPSKKQSIWDRPYFEIGMGRGTKGAQYVKGRGVLLKNRAHAEEVARLNGWKMKDEYR